MNKQQQRTVKPVTQIAERYQNRESKAEIIVQNGQVIETRIVHSKAKPLTGTQLKDFEILVRHYADEIGQSARFAFIFPLMRAFYS